MWSLEYESPFYIPLFLLFLDQVQLTSMKRHSQNFATLLHYSNGSSVIFFCMGIGDRYSLTVPMHIMHYN